MGPAGNQPVHRPLRHLRRDLNRARLVDLPRAVAQVVEGVGLPALLCVDGKGERLGRILQLTTWAGAPPWDVTGVPSCCTIGEGMRALTLFSPPASGLRRPHGCFGQRVPRRLLGREPGRELLGLVAEALQGLEA